MNLNKLTIILLLFLGNLGLSQETPIEDDLGNVSDEFQETYYEALKQKGIENYDKAIELLVECASLEPNNASVHFELGKNYFETNRLNLAENALEKANKLKPNNQWVLETQFRLFKALNKNEKTQKALEALVKLHPKYNQDLVKHYIKTKQFDNAITTLNLLNKSIGNNASYDRLRHQAYIHGRKYDDYASYLTQKIINKTANESNFVNLIFVYTQLKKNDRAFQTAKKYSEQFPLSDKPHLSLYKFELTSGNIDNAIKSLHRVSSSTSLSQSEKFKVANDFFKYAQKHPEHMSEIDKVIKVFTNPTLINQLTQYYQNNNDAKATDLVASAQEGNSNSFQDLKLLADILLKGNQSMDALKTTEKALELYPAQPVLYLQQGKAYLAINKPEKALNSLELGIDYIIENPKLEKEFYLTMAKTYKALNDAVNEQKYLQKAQKIK